jgi:hypothetical protein
MATIRPAFTSALREHFRIGRIERNAGQQNIGSKAHVERLREYECRRFSAHGATTQVILMAGRPPLLGRV